MIPCQSVGKTGRPLTLTGDLTSNRLNLRSPKGQRARSCPAPASDVITHSSLQRIPAVTKRICPQDPYHPQKPDIMILQKIKLSKVSGKRAEKLAQLAVSPSENYGNIPTSKHNAYDSPQLDMDYGQTPPGSSIRRQHTLKLPENRKMKR
ncbi:hypothetical protein EVAR_73340_1, partial [Eumeta japonica]